MDNQQKLLLTARWVGFMPGAVAAAWVAWFLVTVLNRLSMSGSPVDADDSFFGKVFVTITSSGAMGAAFVYAGSRIAPSNRKHVAYILTFIAILFTGFASYPAIVQRNWWAIVSLLFVAIGAAAVAYSVSEQQLDLDSHRLT